LWLLFAMARPILVCSCHAVNATYAPDSDAL
jgi:hypothetical protein